MTSFLDKLKAKKAGQPEPTIDPMDTLRLKIKQHAASHHELARALDLLPTPKAPTANPYNSMALFDQNAPTDPSKVAEAITQAFGADKGIEYVANHTDTALSEGNEAAVLAWELVDEVLGQIIAQQNAKAKRATLNLSKDAEDDLAPESTKPTTEAIAASGKGESFSLNITLNPEQQAARDMAYAGKSFCLVGPAGSGKTTTQRSVAAGLYESGSLGISTFKDVGGGTFSAPSIAFIAFTRRAAGNLRKAIHKDPVLASVFAGNIMTAHALLEFAPEYYWDSVEGKQKFRFAPRRTAANPLNITHLVIEEASMIGAYDLWQMIYDALPEGIQIIFIGDINQLPPVFGPSVLNYALTQLPIVELVETYRNQGKVLDNAHHILKGEPLEETKLCNVIRGNKPIQLAQDTMGNKVIPQLIRTLYDMVDDDGSKTYDPDHDIVLSPFNVQAMGTTNTNNWIAQFLGDRRNAIVHEVLAGFNKVYLAEGDKVMVNKRDGVIIKIARNPQYMGREPQLPGRDLSRFGARLHDRINGLDLDDLDSPDIDYSNFSLENIENQDAERKQQASHIVTVKYDDGFEEELSGSGEFGDAVFSLGWCLTVHKAQGSEWRKVFLLMHKDHSTMLFREWFYTGYTRARIGVTIIAKDYLIEKAIKSPRITGNTLKAKLAYFNSGINSTVHVDCVK